MRMRKTPPWDAIIICTILTALVVFLLFFKFSTSTSLLVESIFNFGHVPLFGIVTAIVLWIIDWRNWPATSPRNYVLAGAAACGLALFSELLQLLVPGRFFQLDDIVNDMVGSMLFLLIAYQHKRGLRKITRLAMNGLACMLLFCAGIPVLPAALDDMRARRDFPILASFETGREMDRWKIEEGYERSSLHATHGIRSLRVDLAPGMFPGVTMSYPPRNWHGFDTMSFNVFLAGKTTLPMTVRINDLAHTEEYDDRYNSTFTLSPGQNTIAIKLADVEHAPKGRLMDMEHISVLCIFSYKLHEPRTVYFDNFRLEKND